MPQERGAGQDGSARTKHCNTLRLAWAQSHDICRCPRGSAGLLPPPQCFLECAKIPCKLNEAHSAADRKGAPYLCSFSAELCVSNDGNFSYADFFPPFGIGNICSGFKNK